jgi:hypothetical protein
VNRHAIENILIIAVGWPFANIVLLGLLDKVNLCRCGYHAPMIGY